MRKYRLIITLFFSFSLHAILIAYLIIHQKNLGFKKGIGEHRIKASFKTLSEIPQESLSSLTRPQPLPKSKAIPTPPTQKPKKIEKKQEKNKEAIKEEKISKEQEKPQETPQEISQATPQEAPQEAQEAQTLEQSLQISP